MIDSKLCPFCKQENSCKVDILNNNCWCNEIKVPLELRALIPEEYKMKACICKECVLLYKRDKELFNNKYLN